MSNPDLKQTMAEMFQKCADAVELARKDENWDGMIQSARSALVASEIHSITTEEKAEYYIHWSYAEIQLGQFEQALVHADKALVHHPASLDARKTWIRAMLGLKRYTKLRPVLERTLKKHPQDPDLGQWYKECVEDGSAVVMALNQKDGKVAAAPKKVTSVLDPAIEFDWDSVAPYGSSVRGIRDWLRSTSEMMDVHDQAWKRQNPGPWYDAVTDNAVIYGTLMHGQIGLEAIRRGVKNLGLVEPNPWIRSLLDGLAIRQGAGMDEHEVRARAATMQWRDVLPDTINGPIVCCGLQDTLRNLSQWTEAFTKAKGNVWPRALRVRVKYVTLPEARGLHRPSPTNLLVPATHDEELTLLPGPVARGEAIPLEQPPEHVTAVVWWLAGVELPTGWQPWYPTTAACQPVEAQPTSILFRGDRPVVLPVPRTKWRGAAVPGMVIDQLLDSKHRNAINRAVQEAVATTRATTVLEVGSASGRAGASASPAQHICIEQEPELVQVGKSLVAPQATWLQTNIFHLPPPSEGAFDPKTTVAVADIFDGTGIGLCAPAVLHQTHKAGWFADTLAAVVPEEVTIVAALASTTPGNPAAWSQYTWWQGCKLLPHGHRSVQLLTKPVEVETLRTRDLAAKTAPSPGPIIERTFDYLDGVDAGVEVDAIVFGIRTLGLDSLAEPTHYGWMIQSLASVTCATRSVPVILRQYGFEYQASYTEQALVDKVCVPVPERPRFDQNWRNNYQEASKHLTDIVQHVQKSALPDRARILEAVTRMMVSTTNFGGRDDVLDALWAFCRDQIKEP